MPRLLELPCGWEWPPAASAASWGKAGGALSALCLGRLFWAQYGILRHRGLPEHDLGLPVLGHTLRVFREALGVMGREMMRGRQALLMNFFFSNVVIVEYPLYMQCVHRAELDGELRPSWMPSMQQLLGERSILVLPGGKGHPMHKRLRGKILASLGSRNVLEMQPELLRLVRQTLDAVAQRTAAQGTAAFEDFAAELASRASVLMITAGLPPAVQERLASLLDATFEGLVAVPVDLGRFSAFGRAKQARRAIAAIVKSAMESPNLERRNIIADLLKTTEDGEAFTLEEIVDTTFTLFMAGRTTTAEALPHLLVRLHENRDWAARVALEPLKFSGVEDDSATIRVVREALRLKPPAGAFRRERLDPSAALDLGAHGRVPPGCPVAVHLLPALLDMGPDFDPDRWTPEVVRDRFIVFGGPQPHACVGRALAMLELQLFARVLCREYEFAALDPELVVNPKLPVDLSYRDGLRVRLKRRGA